MVGIMTAITVEPVAAPVDVERRTHAIGHDIFARIGSGPRLWGRGWWDDRFMSVALADPKVKVQLSRFIDALPVLQSDEQVVRHLAEYLGEAGDRVPWWMRWPVEQARAGSVRGRWL